MELHVMSSDFMLPSASPSSLQFIAAVRICAAPVQLVKVPKAPREIGGSLPVYKEESGRVIRDLKEFTQYFREQLPSTNNLALDSHLSQEDKNHVLSYQSYIEQKLKPAYLAVSYLNNANFNTVSYPWISKTVGFPMGMLHAKSLRSQASSHLRTIYPGSFVTDEQICFATAREAIKCFNFLSNKLGDSKYLFGDRPTSVDAVAFGYLAYFLRIPFPNDTIQKHLKSCLNLVRYTESIISIYLPMTSEELAEQRLGMEKWERRRLEAQIEMESERKEKDTSAEAESEFPRINKIIFGVAAAALTVFALFKYQIVELRVKEIPEERFESERSLPSEL